MSNRALVGPYGNTMPGALWMVALGGGLFLMSEVPQKCPSKPQSSTASVDIWALRAPESARV